MAEPTKTPGQLAYEEDVRRKPFYWGGGQRPGWDQLDDVARWSWERNPTPRTYPQEETIR